MVVVTRVWRANRRSTVTNIATSRSQSGRWNIPDNRFGVAEDVVPKSRTSSKANGCDQATAPATVRRTYAKHVLAAAGVSDARLEDALAAIPREAFLGPGPWPILRWMRLVNPGLVRYVLTPDADPVYLYTDDLVGILPARGINNGQPSFHAWLMAKCKPAVGEHVVHVGAGLGYYSAILAHLVGTAGRVTAIEIDCGLATRAAKNLDACSRARVIHGDGAAVTFGSADVIYVNAGTTKPAEAWLDGLEDGGRLVLPLTIGTSLKSPGLHGSHGGVFLIERHGSEFHAQWIAPVAITPSVGSRDPDAEAALAIAFSKGGWDRVTRLYRSDVIDEDRCWVKGAGWCLAYS
jgi:protein-L-isoaspartate(D-aspartate) O-methyltransferase